MQRRDASITQGRSAFIRSMAKAGKYLTAYAAPLRCSKIMPVVFFQFFPARTIGLANVRVVVLWHLKQSKTLTAVDCARLNKLPLRGMRGAASCTGCNAGLFLLSESCLLRHWKVCRCDLQTQSSVSHGLIAPVNLQQDCSLGRAACFEAHNVLEKHACIACQIFKA